jgi:putative transposase
MVHRTVEIAWEPHRQSEWATFSASRREAARLWADLVVRHRRLRRLKCRWPSKARWYRWAKRRYPGLHSQSVQQIIREFCDAVTSARQLRKQGHAGARYPWRTLHYRDVIYTNQAARLRNGRLILPNADSGTLSIPMPVALPGRLVEVRLSFGTVHVVCQVSEEARSTERTVGVDLGVNTLIAATDGQKALLISGREAKAHVQLRNKRLAEMNARQAKLTNGSRRWKRLQRRRKRTMAKARRVLKDLCHKTTRQVANAFPGAICYIGGSFNDAAQKLGRQQAQQVSQACTAQLTAMLRYKTCDAVQVEEHYTSQTCPVCGARHKCRRTYRCGCGFTGPRDVVGCWNIRQMGLYGEMRAGSVPVLEITYLRPSGRSSPAGTRHVARLGREAHSARVAVSQFPVYDGIGLRTEPPRIDVEVQADPAAVRCVQWGL